jgi:tripartite-type tricarboxylate transporter receptor subunit TctC
LTPFAQSRKHIKLPLVMTKFPRRKFLRLAAGTVVLAATTRVASALDYPTRPVNLVVQYFAGSLSDIVARVIAQSLSKRFGQQVIVEDQPGAGGNIATELVVRAHPDGYTLLNVVAANVWNATLYDNLNFNFIRDITPVACISRTPGVMVVHASFPAQTVPEFIAYAKANPGKINYASGGTGSFPHVAAELFKFMTGVDLVHVPYRSSYVPDLLGAQVHTVFSPIPTVVEQIRDGKLRALAVTGATPSPALPAIPTIDEFVPGYEATALNGIGAPKGTPPEIIDKLNAAVNAALADAELQARLAELGTVPSPMTAAEFGNFIVDETAKWGKIFRAAGIKAQ